MNFKTVHGLGRADYAKKALDAVMSNLHNPEYVDAWVKWFDAQEPDCVVQPGGECCNRDASGCFNCQYSAGVVCPDDCPHPEFYPSDLEEVAHAVVSRIEAELTAVIRRFYPGATGVTTEGPLMELLSAVRADLSEPGYVEGLLPQ